MTEESASPNRRSFMVRTPQVGKASMLVGAAVKEGERIK
jgi:hypothetical protein